MIKFRLLALLMLLMVVILSIAQIVTADSNPSSTSYSESSDATLYYTNVLYPTAHDATSGTVDSASTTIRVGQTGLSQSPFTNYTTGADSNFFPATGYSYCAQTFTPQTSHKISQISIEINRTGAANGTVYVYLESLNGIGAPSGTVLAYGSLNADAVNTFADWVAFNLGDGYNLIAGGTYAIVLAAPNDVINWQADSAGAYSGGSAWYSTTSGSSWINYAGYDLMFAEYSTYGTIWRGVLPFETSLPANANITSAQLGVWLVNSNYGVTTFNLTVVSGSELNDPPIASDYGTLLQSITPLATIGVSSLTSNGYTFIPLNTLGLQAINPNGTTIFGLRSSRDISFTIPTGNEYIDIYSSNKGYGNQPQLIITYTLPALGAPTNFAVSYPLVFTGYVNSGDQLYVFRSSVYYPFTPDQSSSSAYSLQLLNGATVVAQTPLTMWGYKPASIYLSASEALPWAGTYTIKIVSVSNSSISATSTLTSAAWSGSDLGKLDTWVEYTTAWMEIQDKVTLGSYHTTTGIQYQLSEEAGAWFITGIPGLNYVRSDLFLVPGVNTPAGPTTTGTWSSGLYGHWGTYWTGIFDNLGDSVNLSGQWVVSLIFLGIAVGVVIVVRSKTTESPISIAAALPVLAVGILFGVPFYLALVAGVMALFLMLYNMTVARG